jgi:hypothetical protein
LKRLLADTLRRLGGLELKDEDGNDRILELEPPATDDEVRLLEARLPCPIPDDVKDALRVAKDSRMGLWSLSRSSPEDRDQTRW